MPAGTPSSSELASPSALSGDGVGDASTVALGGADSVGLGVGVSDGLSDRVSDGISVGV
jgi:hypothetical protein